MGVHSANYSKPGQVRFRIKHQSAHGYLIVDDLDRALTPFMNKGAAEARLFNMEQEANAKLKRKVRPCMCCQTRFMSEGIHNRLCDRCRHQTEGMA